MKGPTGKKIKEMNEWHRYVWIWQTGAEYSRRLSITCITLGTRRQFLTV